MTLFLKDKFIWDFWTFRREDEFHVFFLQAPRTAHDPELRHGQATVGHAISADLTHWELLPDVLGPGPSGAWDDRAIWTGSVIEHDKRFYLFYTSSNLNENGAIQRIGLATSEDLIHWQRHPQNPILEADGRWYEKLGDSEWNEEAWRDPYLHFDETSGKYYAFICARVNEGPVDGRGAIGLAQSANLTDWEILPPAAAPGEFTQMEVPQLLKIDKRYHLLFTTRSDWHSASRQARFSNGFRFLDGNFALTSHDLNCDYTLADENGLLADEASTFYAAKIVRDRKGKLVILATLDRDQEDQYIGALSNPMPVHIDENGLLRVSQPDPSIVS